MSDRPMLTTFVIKEKVVPKFVEERMYSRL